MEMMKYRFVGICLDCGAEQEIHPHRWKDLGTFEGKVLSCTTCGYINLLDYKNVLFILVNKDLVLTPSQARDVGHETVKYGFAEPTKREVAYSRPEALQRLFPYRELKAVKKRLERIITGAEEAKEYMEEVDKFIDLMGDERRSKLP